MKFCIGDVLWKSGQAFIFSFVAAPAIALLLILFCTVLINSPFKTFLDQARSLAGNITNTSVIVYPEEKVVFTAFRSSGCQRHVANANDAVKQWDSLLFKDYLIVTGIVLICWTASGVINYRREPWHYKIRSSDMTLNYTKLVSKESDGDADK